MNRYEDALQVAANAPDLRTLAHLFVAAVEEVTAEERVPMDDPAVMLIGKHIAFVTHADVSSLTMYSKLVEKCLFMAENKKLQLATLS